MLDGLEAVELRLSEVLVDNEKFRFDSEFFKKEYLKIENLIKSKEFLQLKNADCEIKHPSEIKREYEEENGVWFFRTQNLRPLSIDFTNQVFISEDDANKLANNLIQKNDILITRTGANFGDTAIYQEDYKAIASSHIFLVRNKVFNQSFLSVFLNTEYGRKLINKGMYGGVQPEVAPYYLKNIYIPNLSNTFQLQIETIVKSSHQKLQESKTLYKQAEELLLKELDLFDFKPSEQNIAIKSFQESFGTSGRLDSEYYQPKYDELITHIQKTKFDKLDSIVKINKSIEPGSEAYQDEGIPFVRVSNVTKFGITDTEIHLSKDILKVEDLKKLYPTKNTILLSKDGTVGIAYKIKNETEMITSSALLHLAIKRDDVMPEYLTLVLNSVIVQLQAQRDSGGSIIQHWKPSEIGEILIPIIDTSIQTQIEAKIKQSFELKEESKKLLDLAKRAVEVAIEKDEDEAKKLILGGC